MFIVLVIPLICFAGLFVSLSGLSPIIQSACSARFSVDLTIRVALAEHTCCSCWRERQTWKQFEALR